MKGSPWAGSTREERKVLTVPKKVSVPASATRRRGSAMLESCFCFLVFFSLILGAFDFGQFLFIHQALVERARWALRYGVANYTASTDITAAAAGDATCASVGLTTCVQNEMLYYSSTAGTGGYFGLTSAMVTVTNVIQYASSATCTPSPSGTSTNAMPTCTPNYNSVQILITNYPYKMLALFSAGTYHGPNIYETFPQGQY